uniref:CRAL/TRIO N-terminal domain-containing protein n=1 Tax=Timema cristinae TaxID=61476 RepID=A0A7R9GSZ6_TIMCR|nr:unnamed protein product [Timema cristinae]
MSHLEDNVETGDENVSISDGKFGVAHLASTLLLLRVTLLGDVAQEKAVLFDLEHSELGRLRGRSEGRLVHQGYAEISIRSPEQAVERDGGHMEEIVYDNEGLDRETLVLSSRTGRNHVSGASQLASQSRVERVFTPDRQSVVCQSYLGVEVVGTRDMSTARVILSYPWNEGDAGRKQPQPEQEEDVFHQKDYEWVLGDELAQTAKLELREDKDIRNQALRQFREWINKNQDLHKCCTDSNFLLRFLRVKKFSLPMAQQMLLKYFNLRQTFSHMFQNLDVLSSPVHELISSGYIVVSPKRDKQGRRVIITTAGRFDPYKFKNVDMAKAHMITYEACLDDEQTQIAGFTHVGDVADVSAAFITLWSPTEFSTIVKWGEQSVPMRHKEIHILNVPTALKYVYDFAHNRFSEKMKNRFIVRTVDTS